MRKYIIELTTRSDNPQGRTVTFTEQRCNGFGIWVKERNFSLSFPTLVEARAACMALTRACDGREA